LYTNRLGDELYEKGDTVKRVYDKFSVINFLEQHEIDLTYKDLIKFCELYNAYDTIYIIFSISYSSLKKTD
jgi:hypothetical protein